MKIEAGKQYLARSGEVMTIHTVLEYDTEYPVRGTSRGGSPMSWSAAGRFFTGDDEERPDDLVSEVPERTRSLGEPCTVQVQLLEDNEPRTIPLLGVFEPSKPVSYDPAQQYKVLVVSFRSGSLHSLVVDFPDARQAKAAADIINSSDGNAQSHATLLFKEPA